MKTVNHRDLEKAAEEAQKHRPPLSPDWQTPSTQHAKRDEHRRITSDPLHLTHLCDIDFGISSDSTQDTHSSHRKGKTLSTNPDPATGRKRSNSHPLTKQDIRLTLDTEKSNVEQNQYSPISVERFFADDTTGQEDNRAGLPKQVPPWTEATATKLKKLGVRQGHTDQSGGEASGHTDQSGGEASGQTNNHNTTPNPPDERQIKAATDQESQGNFTTEQASHADPKSKDQKHRTLSFLRSIWRLSLDYTRNVTSTVPSLYNKISSTVLNLTEDRIEKIGKTIGDLILWTLFLPYLYALTTPLITALVVFFYIYHAQRETIITQTNIALNYIRSHDLVSVGNRKEDRPADQKQDNQHRGYLTAIARAAYLYGQSMTRVF